MNRYNESDEVNRKIRTGDIGHGSVVRFRYPSGNSYCVRVHGYDKSRGVMLGCCMSWDNMCLQDYNLNYTIAELVELQAPKEGE